MNLILASLIFFIGFDSIKTQTVNWNGNNWALNCDFVGNDLREVRGQGEQCGGFCASTPGCTHWVFSFWNGGTCWLKRGSVSKANAFYSSSTPSCGVLSESSPIITNPVTSKPNPGPQTGTDALAKFTKCRFTYGRDYVGDGVDYTAYDYITIWMNPIRDGCKNSPSCTDFNEYWTGNMLRKTKELNKIPVFYAYVIAFEARNSWGLLDCDVGQPDLCHRGAKFIRENRARILERYDHHTRNIARIMGREAFTVFLMEPDLWQFYGNRNQEGGTLSGDYMRSLFDDMVRAIKKNLPNAIISWDISAWIGEQGHRTWWGFFSNSKDIDFIHTSGGRMHGELPNLKPNELRWDFLSQTTGKKIIADSGYGIAGAGFNNREPWYQTWNVDSRIRDGVVSITLAGSERNPIYKPSVRFC